MASDIDEAKPAPGGPAPEEAADRPGGWADRFHLWALVELFVLSGFAIAQPLLDVTGKSPDFFLFRRADRLDIVVLVLGVTAAAGPGHLGPRGRGGAGLGDGPALPAPGRHRRAVHPAGHRGGQEADRPARAACWSRSPWPPALLAVVLYVRQSWLRLWLRYLAPAPLVFALVFLLMSPTSKLVLPAQAEHSARPGPGGRGHRRAAAAGDDPVRRVPAQLPARLQGPDRPAGLPELRRAGRPVDLVPQRHRGGRLHPLGHAGDAHRQLPGQGQGPLLHRVPRQHAHPVRPLLRPEGVRDHQPALPAQPLPLHRRQPRPGRAAGRRSATRPGSSRRSSRRTTPPSTRPRSSTRRPPRRPPQGRQAAGPAVPLQPAPAQPAVALQRLPGRPEGHQRPADHALPAPAAAPRPLALPAVGQRVQLQDLRARLQERPDAGPGGRAGPPAAPAPAGLHRRAGRPGHRQAQGRGHVGQVAGGDGGRPRRGLGPGREAAQPRQDQRPRPDVGAPVHQGPRPGQRRRRRPQLGAGRPAPDRRRPGRHPGALEDGGRLPDRQADPHPDREVVVRHPRPPGGPRRARPTGRQVLAGETDTLVRASEGVRGLYRYGAFADLVYRDPASVGPVTTDQEATAVLDDFKQYTQIKPKSGRSRRWSRASSPRRCPRPPAPSWSPSTARSAASPSCSPSGPASRRPSSP